MLKNNGFVKLALCVLAVFCAVAIVTLQLQFNALREQKDRLAEDIEGTKGRIGVLQATLDTPFDEEYIIRIAREKLNLRLPEEVVFYNDVEE